MLREKLRTLHLPRGLDRQWRIEAPGCVIWIRPTPGSKDRQGTAVGIDCDGDRYGEGMVAQIRQSTADKGYIKVLVEPVD